MPAQARPNVTRRRLPTAERRLQLLDVAVRVFGRHGYAGASTEDIASEVGISAPALYRHYRSKKALYLAALAHTGDRMFAQWEQAARESSDALSAFSRLGLLYQQMMTDEPYLLQMRFRAINATEEPEIRELAIRHHRRAHALLSKLAERAEREGLLPGGVTPALVVAGFLAWGAISDVTQHLGLNKTKDAEVFATALLDTVKLLSRLRASDGVFQRLPLNRQKGLRKGAQKRVRRR